jgi:hypothetical protein
LYYLEPALHPGIMVMKDQESESWSLEILFLRKYNTP